MPVSFGLIQQRKRLVGAFMEHAENPVVRVAGVFDVANTTLMAEEVLHVEA